MMGVRIGRGSLGHANNFQEGGHICRSTMANMNPHRRQFLKTATVAAAVMSLPEKSGAEQAGLFPGFQTRRVATSGAEINLVTAGSGPPLLLLHGFPESHVSWHKIAPRLAERFTVVAPDLRGYGDSSKPADGENHVNYSKRAMVLDQIEMMRAMGFDRFAVAGHDRGGRVAWRLAVEHPDVATQVAVLDIVPDHYSSVTREFATAYFHWFFLIQPAPFPEQLIAGNPEAFLRRFLSASYIAPEAMANYVRCFSDPLTIHAACEDYRAGATIDLVHSKETRGRRVKCPLLVLWGERSTIARLYDVRKVWREQGSDIRAKAMPAGHHLAEELPEQTLAELTAFLRS